MYFQTGQVFFVPEWPKGEFVSIIGLILFGQNHLYVKDAVLQGIPLFKRVSEDSACKTENLRFPVSRPDDRAIHSGRPSVHYSIRPDDVPYRLDARQTKHHPSGRRDFPSGCTTVSRSFCSSLHPSGRLSSPSGRLLVIDQLQILSKFNLREDCSNRPDDVDFRPDTLLHKARIAIQISLSGRQSALVRTRVHQLRKLPIRLQPFGRLPPWSGRAHSKYGNCMLKISRLDVHPPWFGRAKPYMEVTCSGRATVRTTVSYRLDAALKQERFSAKMSKYYVALLSVRTAQVHRPDGVHTYYSSRPFCTSAYK
jgi:hypothetical protein